MCVYSSWRKPQSISLFIRLSLERCFGFYTGNDKCECVFLFFGFVLFFSVHFLLCLSGYQTGGIPFQNPAA